MGREEGIMVWRERTLLFRGDIALTCALVIVERRRGEWLGGREEKERREKGWENGAEGERRRRGGVNGREVERR